VDPTPDQVRGDGAGMTRKGIVVLLMVVAGVSSTTTFAQHAVPSEAVPVTTELEPTIRALLQAIESLSDYRAPEALPPVYQLRQNLIEAKVCEEPCNVTAAYVPHEGIYLAQNLDPVHEPRDRAALLHELVHYLQQGHPKFAQMAPCERERMKEQEAYALQNAYLEMIGSPEPAVFYDGEFDCGGEHPVRSQ
jgi:hypothetical protein